MTVQKSDNSKHIAIILDGNRRFAEKKGIPKLSGHYYGAKKVEDLLEWIKEFEIKELTLYVLSTENLNRSKEELNALFKLFKEFFTKFKDDPRIKKDSVKINFIGDLSLAPLDLKKLFLEIQEKTKNYDRRILNFCIGYGGRAEIVSCFNKLKNNKDDITEEDITKNLWLTSEPDIIIRTGDSMRTSNFLPWQSVYSEWFFLKKMWPEFEKEDLKNIIEEFNKRKRNFGK
jgi:tritrans,polycis-undecaprenyl-diphosphate synthase [geranylgeranyl-diphosphate specific]